MILVTLTPHGRGLYSARLADGHVVCKPSTNTNIYSIARALLREGIDPTASVATRHEGHSYISMTGTVGRVALWTVTETDKHGLRLVRYRPRAEELNTVRSEMLLAVSPSEAPAAFVVASAMIPA